MQFWIKRFLFLFLRLRNEIAFFEGRQEPSGQHLTVCYIGDAMRRKYFVSQVFGYLPQSRVVGTCLSTHGALRFEKFNTTSDIVMIEINRLFLSNFVRSGFYPVPEWVEFERPVVSDAQHRYVGASKSLKSDLSRIQRSGYRIDISKNAKDFNLFYDTMYLPYVWKRHGSDGIIKPRRRLKKECSSGLLVFLLNGEIPVAGAIVVVEKDTVRETTIGVRDGSEEVLKTGVSGILDYHIHEWAAVQGKRFMNVGHTRPFPSDGVYFNKRKWMMTVIPDRDGVTNIAIRFNLPTQKAAGLLSAFPFIFQTSEGLNLLCSLDQQEPVTLEQINSVYKRFWNEGLNRLIVLAPAGFAPQAFEYGRNEDGSALVRISELEEATRSLIFESEYSAFHRVR